jgi:queuine tRNA-ribosyltransferase
VTAPFAFDLQHEDGHARRGRLVLPHGVVETPAFMPVGTRGAIKGLTIDQVIALDPDIILANTYHLHLRPGDGLIGDLGGLHRFMGWERPILTDSGGYQVFSLASRRRLNEDGVVFQSHLDGRALSLSPESAVDIQARLGSDISMVFDECPAWPATVEQAEASMERTLRWARRGRDHFLKVRASQVDGVTPSTPGQVQFGIIQGGTWPALRDRSVAGTVAVGFDAYAIGGLSVGEPTDVMYQVVAHTAQQLPRHLPRYLMGAGMPDDLVECVAAVHAERADRDQEREVRARSIPAGSGLWLPHLPAALPRLSAAPVHGRRDERRRPEHGA